MQTCLDAALELLDRGFSVIPIRTGSKKPLLATWLEFQQRQATPEEAEAWFQRWPEASLALITGAISGLWALDADGPAGEAWLKEHAPAASVYQRTPRGGLHALFCLPEGVQVRNGVRVAPELDVRGEGGYILVDPSPGYRWEFPAAMDGWDGLTTWAPPSARSEPEPPGVGNLRLDLSATPDPAGQLQAVAQGGRNNALAVKVGRWLGLGLELEEALLASHAWNQRYCQPPLGEKELKATVRSLWRTHQRNHPQVAPDPEARPAPPALAAPAMPEGLLRPGGLLTQITDYIEAASAASHPLFNLAAAISLLGSVAGQRVMTETGLRTNIYAICVGYAGSGKDAPHSAIEAILSRTTAANLLGPNDPTSGAAILHWIAKERQQSTLLRLDEVGHLLKAGRDMRSPAHQVPSVLMQLFSATDRGYSKSYAGADPIKLWWHHLCLYGSSTPLRWWEAMTSGDVIDGFLARILVFESRHPAELPRAAIRPEPPKSLTTALDLIHGLPIEWDDSAGNLATRPVPLVVHKTREALEVFAPWALKHHKLRNATREDAPVSSALHGRAAEHASKLALVHALSRHGHLAPDEGVGPEDVAWACELVGHLVNATVRSVGDNVADNPWHRLEQKALAIVDRLTTPERPWAAARDIMRHLHQPSKTVKDLLETMVSTGALVALDHKGDKGPVKKLFARAAR